MTQVQTQSKNPIKAYFNSDAVNKKFTEIMGKRSTSFITSVLQISAQNQLLANAEPSSVYQAAMVAATLDLPLNQNLGFAYIIPFKQKAKGNIPEKVVAQFQLGYKGFIQLAQRSGQFKTISATPITNGQLVSENPLLGYEFDFSKKGHENIIIGYAAYFKLLNGFEKTLYMSVEELKAHGNKFSQSFKSGYGLWKDDFDSMAIKTVIKLLLSKYAPLSVDMQKAIITDQSVVEDAETIDTTYIDAKPEAKSKEEERLSFLIADAKSVEDLLKFKESIPNSLYSEFEDKFAELAELEEAK